MDYPSDAVKAAATAAILKARSDFHIIWLTEIIAACSPNTNAHIVKMMEKITFGEGATGGITGRFYQEDDSYPVHGQTHAASTRTWRPHADRTDEQGEARHR